MPCCPDFPYTIWNPCTLGILLVWQSTRTCYLLLVSTKTTPLWTLCRQPNSVWHLVLTCPRYIKQWSWSLKKFPRSPSFLDKNVINKIRYNLDLECQAEIISQWCTFISDKHALGEWQSVTNNKWSNLSLMYRSDTSLIFDIVWGRRRRSVKHRFRWWLANCSTPCYYLK